MNSVNRESEQPMALPNLMPESLPEPFSDALQQRLIRPRQAVAALSPYLPPLEGRRQSLRLDFNENTSPPSDALACFQTALAEESSIYPEYDEFIAKLSESLNIPAECLLLTNGSDEGLCVIAWTFIEPKVDTALTVTPTFALIPHSLKLAESNLVEIPYAADWSYDVLAIEAALEKGVKLAVFASPDNPAGAVLPVAVLERWAKQFPQTLFVMDEAYAEYAGQTALPFALSLPNVLVTRTFSKAWGLAGLRLGLVIGASALIAELKKVRSPYSVNVAAIAAAEALLPAYETVLSEASATMARKLQVLQEVESRGYQIVPGYGNFFMMGLGIAAPQFCKFMKQAGILVRDRSSMHPRLKGWVRVSIGTEAEMDRFMATLDAFMQRTAIVFDLDGTLVDTTKSFDRVIEMLVLQHSGQAVLEGEINALRAEGGFNDDWDATVELLKRRGVIIPFETIACEGLDLYLQIAKDMETWLLDPAILTQLSKRYRLAVATGRTRAEFEPVWGDRLSPYFEYVICQDDHASAAKKPAPDIIVNALQKLNAEAGFYVGNSVDDMTASLAAGLYPVAVATTLSPESLLNAGAQCLLPEPGNVLDAFQLGA